MVAVKGLKMPENCDDHCPIRAMALCYCQQAHQSTSHGPGGKPLRKAGRPSFCPLIEIDEKVVKRKRAVKKGD